jgi:hypothetical protein
VNDSIHTKKLAVKNIPHSTKIGECEPTIDARRIWTPPKTTFRSWFDGGSSGFSGWLQQTMHGAEEIFGREGFAEKRVRQLLDLRDISAVGFTPGQPAHGEQPEVGVKLQQGAGQCYAADTRHVNIGDHEGDSAGMGVKQGDRLNAIAAAHDAITIMTGLWVVV